MERKLINIQELSGYLGVPLPTLYTWTHLKKIPYVKIGRVLRFDRVEIDDWVEKKKVGVLNFGSLRQD